MFTVKTTHKSYYTDNSHRLKPKLSLTKRRRLASSLQESYATGAKLQQRTPSRATEPLRMKSTLGAAVSLLSKTRLLPFHCTAHTLFFSSLEFQSFFSIVYLYFNPLIPLPMHLPQLALNVANQFCFVCFLGLTDFEIRVLFGTLN